MKLYFHEGPRLWDAGRYHYAAEQMMLTLFPGERPEYPQAPPEEGEDGAVFRLAAEGESAEITALVQWQGRRAAGTAEFPAKELDAAPETVYHCVQHALKLAFYRAGTALLGHEPPWGALTGVRPVKLPARAMNRGASPAQAREELEGEYRVSPARAALAVDCARASLAAEGSLRPGEVSLYIGIPFCPTRCAYCSFVSAGVDRTLKLVEPYLEGLLSELEGAARAMLKAGLSVRTLYMGGGTPTTLTAEQLDRLLTRCEEALPLARCTERTVEAGRPDTITEEKLAVLAGHGVDRLSINPQTMEPRVLSAIGRRHAPEDIPAAFALARRAGFRCINMDLIAGLPRDSFSGFCRSLEGVLALAPENITVHTLALKRGSALMEHPEDLPGGEETARMLDFSAQTLGDRGYVPYYLYRQKYMSGALENVGWTLPGRESLYNIVMMEELQTVISVGAGGVTKLVDTQAGKLTRLSNPKYPRDYLAGLPGVLAQKSDLATFFSTK